jgi:hypothetical protein
MVGLGEAAELVSPLEGSVYEPGQSFVIRVEPGPGEKLISMLVGFNEVKPNSDGILEYTVNIPVKIKPGSNKKAGAAVSLYDINGQYKEIELSHNTTVVLPPTTVVRGIGASFAGDKETFLQIARKPTGELVPSGSSNDAELTAGATYSDGIRRRIADNPNTTYKSLNEKVAIVFPSGQWKDLKGEVGTGYALVMATGPGKTSIIVQYGEFTDRVTVHVKECPYTEGMKRCPR